MPFMRIYKLNDNKWHIPTWHKTGSVTECGVVLGNDNIIDERVLGKQPYQPDPPKSEVCKKCFSFLEGI